jgi:hypothetical protein
MKKIAFRLSLFIVLGFMMLSVNVLNDNPINIEKQPNPITNPQPSNILFNDDFSWGLVNWQPATGLWHLTNSTSNNSNPYHSPSNAVWFGINANGTFNNGSRVRGILESSQISLLGEQQAYLRFWSRKQVDSRPNYDITQVNISAGGISTNIYSDKSTLLDWTLITINISIFCGNLISIQFIFDSIDEYYNDLLGWMIDDVVITTESSLIHPNAPILTLNCPKLSNTGEISFYWNNVSGALTYTIFRSSHPITSIIGLSPIADKITGISFIDFVTENGTYYYSIIAVNGSGMSVLSNSEFVVVEKIINPGSAAAEFIGFEDSRSNIRILNGQNIWYKLELTHEMSNFSITLYSAEYNLSSLTLTIYGVNSNTTTIGTIVRGNYSIHGYISSGATPGIYYIKISTSLIYSPILFNWILNPNNIVEATNFTAAFDLGNSGDYRIIDNLQCRDDDYFKAFIAVGQRMMIRITTMDYTSMKLAIYSTNTQFILNNTPVVESVSNYETSMYLSYAPLVSDYFYFKIFDENGQGNYNLYFYRINNNSLIPPLSPILNILSPTPSPKGNVFLQWKAVTGAINYKIFRATTKINTTQGMLPIVYDYTQTEFNDTGLTNGNHSYVIVASNLYGDSAQSICRTVRIAIPPPPDTPILNKFQPNSTQTGNITLQWNSVKGTTYYRVFRNTNLIESIEGLTPIAPQVFGTTYQDLYLPNGTYYYVIVAVNDIGSSNISNCEAMDVRIPPPATPILDAIVPNPSTTGNITLEWNIVPGAISYQVYRSTNPIESITGLTPIATGITGTTYVDKGLTNNTFYYAIVAVGLFSSSEPSNNQSVIIGLPPSIPIAVYLNQILPDPSNGTINLSWNQVWGAEEYLIFRSNTTISDTSTMIPVAIVTTNSFQDIINITTIPFYMKYYYVIVARNQMGTSPMSNIQEIRVSVLNSSVGSTNTTTTTTSTTSLPQDKSTDSKIAGYPISLIGVISVFGIYLLLKRKWDY